MKDLNHIKRLFQFLAEEDDGDHEVSIGLKSARSVLLSDHDRKKDNAGASIFWKRGEGLVVGISSWNESHHNGDPYAISDRSIYLGGGTHEAGEIGKFGEGDYEEGPSIHEIYAAVEMDLETQAMEKASREYKAQKELEEKALVREFLFRKLGY